MGRQRGPAVARTAPSSAGAGGGTAALAASPFPGAGHVNSVRTRTVPSDGAEEGSFIVHTALPWLAAWAAAARPVAPALPPRAVLVATVVPPATAWRRKRNVIWRWDKREPAVS